MLKSSKTAILCIDCKKAFFNLDSNRGGPKRQLCNNCRLVRYKAIKEKCRATKKLERNHLKHFVSPKIKAFENWGIETKKMCVCVQAIAEATFK